MENILTVIFAVIFVSAFVLALFWIVAKTIGRIPVVKNSPTLDEAKARAEEEYARNAENLSETVRALAEAGDKFGAAKTYKEETGVSLMEAKKTVEAYLSQPKHEC